MMKPQRQDADTMIEIVGSTPAEFGTFFREEIDRWAKITKGTGAKISHASFQQKNYLTVYHILHSFFSRPDPVYTAASTARRASP
jgi:hypothetical protein